MGKSSKKVLPGLSELIGLRARLKSEADQVGADILSLTNRKRTLDREILEIDWLIDEQTTRPGDTLEAAPTITRKNIDIHKAWSAMRRSLENLSEGRSLSNARLFEDVRKILPELKQNPFRYYIHRFHKDGLIRSSGSGRWQLVKNKEQ